MSVRSSNVSKLQRKIKEMRSSFSVAIAVITQLFGKKKRCCMETVREKSEQQLTLQNGQHRAGVFKTFRFA